MSRLTRYNRAEAGTVFFFVRDKDFRLGTKIFLGSLYNVQRKFSEKLLISLVKITVLPEKSNFWWRYAPKHCNILGLFYTILPKWSFFGCASRRGVFFAFLQRKNFLYKDFFVIFVHVQSGAYKKKTVDNYMRSFCVSWRLIFRFIGF